MKLLARRLAVLNVSTPSGAPMGRQSWIDPSDQFLHLEPMPMVNGDYDPGGAYWGCGTRGCGDMWCAFSPSGSTMVFFRADHTMHATTMAASELDKLGHPSAAEIHWHIDGGRDYLTTDTTAQSRWMASVMVPPNHPRLLQHYLTAIRFTEQERHGLEVNEGTEFTAHALERAAEDIDLFAQLLARYPTKCAEVFHNRKAWEDVEQLAHDIWFTRQHEGAGFWDRGYGSAGQILTEVAHSLGEVSVYVTGDGQLGFD